MEIILSRDEYLALLQYKVKVVLGMYERGHRNAATDALVELFELEVKE